MARIEFEGLGVPIPTIALPPFGSDSDLPSTVLTFLDNVEFPVKQYRDLGFTHFEAWCVGGAGGRGGDASSQMSFVVEQVQRPVPQDVWNLQLELAAIADYAWQIQARFNNPSLPPPEYNRAYGIVSNVPPYWNSGYFSGPPGNYEYVMATYGAGQPVGYWPVGLLVTTQGIYEAQHPQHLMTFYTYRSAKLYPSTEGLGGGGGGGGLHMTFGMLSDLPDSVAVVVGKGGADAGIAQVKQLGSWTPLPPGYTRSTYFDPYFTRRDEINEWLHNYTHSYPEPTTFAGNPQPGQAGGTSSFGDVANASGGAGGGAGMIWDGAKFIRKGDGGNGGVGERLEAGGGGLGSTTVGVNGSEGIWRPETGIGEGGGGGKAAGTPPPPSDPRFGPAGPPAPLPTAGGRGSYSYADTSVYGQRQFRQLWAYSTPNNPVYVAGGGGGARPGKNLKHGSRAVGFSPDGVVVLRLSQILT